MSWSIRVDYIDSVDLVVAVHGAGLTPTERAVLAGDVDRGLRGLLDGDVDRDGLRDALPFRSVRVAVVSADAGDESGTDGCTAIGRDGRFVGCGPDLWTTIDDGIDELALERVACAVDLAATTSCERARPLDALALALLPETVDVAGRAAHGSAEHAGFLRAHAALGLLVVSPADDCSGPLTAGADPVEVRCARRGGVSLPLDALLGLPRAPQLLRAVALGGYRETANDAGGLEAIAAVEPTIVAGGIEPVCARGTIPVRPAPGTAAFSARMARGGGDAWVMPLCDADAAWTTSLFDLAAPALSASCLPRSLAASADGTFDCTLRVVLPAPEWRVRWPSCAALGLLSLGPSPEAPEREVCEVPQRPLAEIEAAPAPSFAYDGSPDALEACAPVASGGRLVFSFEARDLDAGSDLQLDCAIDPSDGSVCG